MKVFSASTKNHMLAKKKRFMHLYLHHYLSFYLLFHHVSTIFFRPKTEIWKIIATASSSEYCHLYLRYPPLLLLLLSLTFATDKPFKKKSDSRKTKNVTCVGRRCVFYTSILFILLFLKTGSNSLCFSQNVPTLKPNM